MLLYLIVIIGFSLLLHLAEIAKTKEGYFIYYSITLFALIGISIFSGIRNLQVGIDIETYGKGIFEITAISGIKEASVVYSRWADIGYIYFNYMVSLFSKNIHVFLGALTFVSQLSFIVFFRKYRNELSPAFASLLLNLAMFVYSFSMLRQIFATTFLVWSVYFLMKRKYFLFALLSLLTVTSHKSTILIIAIILITYIFTMIKEKFKEPKLLWITLLVTFLFSVILGRYPEILNSITRRLNISNIQIENFGSPARLLIFIFPIIYFRIVNKNNFVKKNQDYFLYLLSLIVVSFAWLSGINYSISRFVTYLFPFYMLFVSKQAKKSNAINSYIILIMWGIIVFWWLIVRGNEGGAIPYTPYWKGFIPNYNF